MHNQFAFACFKHQVRYILHLYQKNEDNNIAHNYAKRRLKYFIRQFSSEFAVRYVV